MASVAQCRGRRRLQRQQGVGLPVTGRTKGIGPPLGFHERTIDEPWFVCRLYFYSMV
jgi:hypothetical protein